jgi:hypothetical protein
MNKISIPLTDQQAEALAKIASRLRVEPEDLAQAAVTDLLSKQDDDYEEAAKYLLEKNRELYRRLS